MKSSNKITVGKGGNFDSNAGPAKEFKPGVYSLKSNPVNVGRNQSSVHELSMGTKTGGDKYKGTQGK